MHFNYLNIPTNHIIQHNKIVNRQLILFTSILLHDVCTKCIYRLNIIMFCALGLIHGGQVYL